MLPLAGLRIVQFGDGLTPQMVGLSLADLGADVVRFGAPGADPLSAALERGKRVFDGDLATLGKLVAGADAIIEPRLAPPGLEDLISATTIRLSLPAFPSGDARFAGKAEDEGTVLAAAGVLAERGPTNRLRGLGPSSMPLPIASAYAAAFGTLGLLAAVFGRQRFGLGDAIEVSLFGALMEGFSYNHVKIDGMPSRYVDPRSAVADADLPLAEDEVQALIDPLYRAFQCADGAWFYVATPQHAGLVQRTLRLFGLWDELLAEGLPTDDPYLSTRDWNDQAEGSIYAYPQLAPHWRDRIRTAVAALIRTRPAAHWEAEFAAHGLCGARVRSSAQWLLSPEARNAGLAITLDDPLAGPMICAGPFAWAGDGLPARPREIVDGDGLAWREEAWPLPAPSAPVPFLSGVRVLDLCNVIAGPTMAGCLTRFGAEVIKIDAPRPGFDPFITVLLSLQSARGKASILLDLARDQGREAFARLARSADLVTFNGPQAQIDALGFDMRRLAMHNRAIVLAQVSAFGGPAPGPLSGRKGVDEVLQAATGVMHRLKPENAPPEEYAHFGTIDVATGVWGSVAALAGLIHARSSGQGGQVATSLAAGAAAVQMPYLWASDAEGSAPDAIGNASPAAFGRIDGDFHVAPDGRREPLARYEDLRRKLAVARDKEGATVGFVRHADHPVGRPVELVTQCAIASRGFPLVTPDHPRKYGTDTRKIFAGHGLDDAWIDALIESGAAADSWPNHTQFLPD